MKKAIVTGAGGFIGGAVVKKLLEKNIIVYGIDVSHTSIEKFKEYENFIPVIADFTHYNNLQNLISDEVDVFYHFAWQGVFGNAFKDYELQLSNARYACDAIMAAVQIGCKKFVFAGTSNQVDILNFLSSEISEPRYTYIYSGSKTMAEIICKTLAYNNNIEYCAGLIAMAYGENNKSMMIPNVVMKQLIRNESPKLISGENLYDMIYIDDIAEAFYCIGESGHNLKSYYVGHRDLKTFKEIITEIGQILNPNVELQFGAYPGTDDKDYSLIDLDALYNDTGFECKANFQESIIRTAEWLKLQDI